MYLVKIGRRAMACEFEVILNAKQHEGGEEAAVEALDLVERLEDQLTVYRDHSEVSQLNRRAADGPVRVERSLFDLLRLSMDIYRQTGGAFDITSGPLVKTWGFFRREGKMPSADDVQQALEVVGGRHLDLDASTCSVRFLRPGVEINLGGIGKGYALDRCADMLRSWGVSDFLLHGGKSSVLARGASADALGGAAWSVGLKHPLRPDRRLAEIRLSDQAIGTSGTATQFFRHQGQRYGHILDPRTGWPTEGMYSSTVLAPTAAEADALATAYYVLGVEKALKHCERRDDLAAVLIAPGKRSGAIEIFQSGLNEDQLQLKSL